MHWNSADRKLCRDTRKVSVHWREKYSAKVGFCSGAKMKGRANQSRHSTAPWSSAPIRWKNSWVLSWFPFWKIHNIYHVNNINVNIILTILISFWRIGNINRGVMFCILHFLYNCMFSHCLHFHQWTLAVVYVVWKIFFLSWIQIGFWKDIFNLYHSDVTQELKTALIGLHICDPVYLVVYQVDLYGVDDIVAVQASG